MNDLISRQMLLEYIHGEPVGRLLCDKYNLDGLIKQFPSAQPEPCEDAISRQAAIDAINRYGSVWMEYTEIMSVDELAERALKASKQSMVKILHDLPSAQPKIVRCKDCKNNPKHEWFGCPMSHLNEKQRPETAWCWKGERRTDE